MVHKRKRGCVSRLVGRVAQFLAREFPENEPGVVAVSGGPDSVALACVLARLQAEGRVGPLTLAHLNHQLRGAESDADETFVAELAHQLSATEGIVLKFHNQRQDVAAMARAGRHNLEHLARQLRYDWLSEVARQEGARWIATGHSADDQAETVLHHLLRGTGLTGLRGIAPRRQLAGGIVLIRPLLKITRAEIMRYLADMNQLFREDSSNRDLKLTRNRLRRELLPELASKFNPAVARVLSRLAEQARDLHRIIASEARALLHKAELPRAGKLLIFSRQALAAAPRHRLQEMFRLVWQREGWPAGAMTFESWSRLADLVRGRAKAVDLPGGIRARSIGAMVQLKGARSASAGCHDK